jgi:2-oxo-4-hydroxy-4-carboxy--5-ureidoimidazoline (OHCU) decarboxylase
MHPATLLQKFGISELTPEEEAELTRELSAAYHMDEAAASSRDVQRIAEKVRARLKNSEPDTTPTGTQ